MSKEAISFHKKLQGKIFVGSKIDKITEKNLQLIYTPGVATVCNEIFKNRKTRYQLTAKGNNVAIITDGTRILGLGDIGPDAALPVMEGKSVLYRKYGNISAFPICLDTKDKDKIIETVKAISPVFGAINLEDIESPKVLDISKVLEEELDIPVFHDDRHGTSVVVLAALLNSLVLVKKKMAEVKIVIVGAGSAGYGIGNLLYFAGCKNIIVLDSKGAIYKGREESMNKYKDEIAEFTNREAKGHIDDVIAGADVFIGVSGIKNLLKSEMIKKMSQNPIVFALTNPDPEINPVLAKKAGAKIVATGSFSYENKVNNALVFPYLMRAILDLKIQKITLDTLYAVSVAIAKTIPKNKLKEDNIIPEIGNKSLQKRITNAIK
ncbi:NAD(P)-dependent malic enzyme [Candidatus Nitrosarchaeum limnium]|jgi:malate dehydrogenase (oxaloacetate-decarboxylating)|uniref:Malic enzyme, NAD binding domain protein n=1 Tax=Candidatus Nitrosarchaeum limnium BG20 TaxID=859192 RepID=S2EWA1_9ARCH|nr:NADP-dependent malic enzyme [Candidatus Nitrosarchaeum limnium]EPA06504.1 malic enzyme, NAD binding domain protein [Candidatus Nitrosarchaeum limnium BG20]